MTDQSEAVPSVRVDGITYENAVGRVLKSGTVHISRAVHPWDHMAEHAPGTWENVYFNFPARPRSGRTVDPE